MKSSLFESPIRREPRTEYPEHILRERLLRTIEEDFPKETITGDEYADRMVAGLGSFRHKPGAERMIAAIRELPEEPVFSFVERVVPIVQRWIVEDFGTVKNFENASRELRAERRREYDERRQVVLAHSPGEFISSEVQVNTLVNYNLFRNGEELALHIDSAVDLSDEGPMKVLEVFRDGLHDIATRLTTDPELSRVKTIKGTSPLVLKFARVVERMGFQIDRDDNGAIIETGRWVRQGKMRMSREEFLRRFL